MPALRPQGIPVEAQTTHVHLSERHTVLLFGNHFSPSILRPRPYLQGQFIYREDVRAVGPKGMLPRVQIFGPVWEKTQMELTDADAELLGLKPPRRDSGELSRAASVKIQGPAGVVELTSAVIVPRPHLHLSPDDAASLGAKNGDRVVVCLEHDPREVFKDVAVRVHPSYQSVFHVALGDASPAWLHPGIHIQLVHR